MYDSIQLTIIYTLGIYCAWYLTYIPKHTSIGVSLSLGWLGKKSRAAAKCVQFDPTYNYRYKFLQLLDDPN